MVTSDSHQPNSALIRSSLLFVVFSKLKIIQQIDRSRYGMPWKLKEIYFTDQKKNFNGRKLIWEKFSLKMSTEKTASKFQGETTDMKCNDLVPCNVSWDLYWQTLIWDSTSDFPLGFDSKTPQTFQPLTNFNQKS